MTTRVLTSLFQPATAVVGRLKYAQKFVVVGLVLLVPLGFVATAYVQLQRAQLAFSAKERDGVAMMAPLIRLTATAAQARHESVGNSHDGTASRDLTTAIAAVDAADR